MADAISAKYPSLPPNYVSIAQLQERWLQRKQQEKEKQETPLDQNQEKIENDVSVHKASRDHVGFWEEKPSPVYKASRVHTGFEVGLKIGKEPVIEGSFDGKRGNFKNKKKGYFVKRKNRAKEEIMTVLSVENGERELSKGDQLIKEVKEGGRPVIHRVSNHVPVASGFLLKNKEVKEGGEPIIDRVSNCVPLDSGMSQLSKNKEVKEGGTPVIERVSNCVPLSSGNSRLSKDKEVKEVGTVDMVEVVEGSKVDREIPIQRRRAGFRVKKDGRRMMGGKSGEIGDKVDNVEQSRQELNAKEKEVSANVNERANEKGRIRGAFRENDDKTRDVTGNVASVSTIDMAEAEIMTVVEGGGKELSKGRYQLKNKNKEIKEVDTKENAGQRSKAGYRGKKDSRRMVGGKFGKVEGKADSVEQSEQENNAAKEVVSDNVKERTNEKVRVRGAFRENNNKRRDATGNVASVSTVAMAEEEIMTVVEGSGKEISKGRYQLNSENKEIKDVGTVYMAEVVGENKVDKENAGHRSKVGYRGKKDSRRMIGGKFVKVGVKADSVEQSGQENNAEKEVASDNVKETTNEKARLRGAFCEHGDKRRDVAEEEIMTVVSVENCEKELSKGKYQLKSENKEIKEVCSVYMVEAIEENNVGKEIPVQRSRVGFRVKKDSRRMEGIKVGEVGDKADSVEQSRQENNVKEEEISVDVKERTNEKVGVRGGNGYGDTRGDVSLVDSEVNMKIESNFGKLSLTGKRYGYGKSSVRVHGDKGRYGSSRRYEPRKMRKPRDSSFVWVKKGESSHGNDAEIETQVDSSSQSTSQSQLCSQ